MKILHIIPSYKPAYVYGGPIVSVGQLCEGQANLGHHVEVFTSTANGVKELAVEVKTPQNVAGVSVTYFKRITGDHTHISPTLWRHLWNNCRRYNVVHIHSWWSPLIVFSTVICILRGIKPVLSPRGMLGDYTFDSDHSLLKKLIHWSIGKSLLKKTVLHATTKMELEECLKIYPKWPHFVLPNMVGLPHNLPERTHSEIFTLTFLSRIDPKKGLELMLKALANVNFPFIFKIAGKGEQDYIDSLIQLSITLGISEKVIWVGWKDRDEKFDFLGDADLMILTSYNENFANVVVESLSVGTCVLLSNKVGLSDYVQDKGFGWICQMSVDDITFKLKDAYKASVYRSSIRQKAPEIIKEDFSGETLAGKYVEAYSSY